MCNFINLLLQHIRPWVSSCHRATPTRAPDNTHQHPNPASNTAPTIRARARQNRETMREDPHTRLPAAWASVCPCAACPLSKSSAASSAASTNRELAARGRARQRFDERLARARRRDRDRRKAATAQIQPAAGSCRGQIFVFAAAMRLARPARRSRRAQPWPAPPMHR